MSNEEFSNQEAKMMGMLTLPVLVLGACISVGFVYMVADVYRANQQVIVPAAIGGFIGLLCSVPVCAKTTGSIFDLMTRFGAPIGIGILIGTLLGFAL